jgi:hypothetical protein
MDIQKRESIDRFGEKIKKAGGLYDALNDYSETLLLDTSSSMESTMEGTTLYNHLKVAVAEYDDIPMVGFSSAPYNIPDLGAMNPRAAGCTNLLSALEHCHNLGSKHIMLISDGLPDMGGASSIEYAKAKGLKISTLFIGDKERGLEFMKKIAQETSGNHAGNVTLMKELNGFGSRLLKGVRALIEG